MAWFVPAMMAASTAMTIMGHKQNIKNIKANAAWKTYENTLQLEYDKQKLFKKQQLNFQNIIICVMLNNVYCIIA